MDDNVTPLYAIEQAINFLEINRTGHPVDKQVDVSVALTWLRRAKDELAKAELVAQHGVYECKCCECGKTFYGFKRQIACGECKEKKEREKNEIN